MRFETDGLAEARDATGFALDAAFARDFGFGFGFAGVARFATGFDPGFVAGFVAGLDLGFAAVAGFDVEAARCEARRLPAAVDAR